MIILHAEVLRLRTGPDHVILHTDMPGVFPEEPRLTLEFTAPRGEGVKYLTANFPGTVLSRVGEMPDHAVKFSR